MKHEELQMSAGVPLPTCKKTILAGASMFILGLLIFMLGAAGSKVSPSLPPTIDPAVACKRPKTATPYFPSAKAKDLIRTRVDLHFGDRDLDLYLSETSDLVSIPSTPRFSELPKDSVRPRYLQPYRRSSPSGMTSPPA